MLIEKKDHMSVDYWNNIEIEKTKPYWVEDESDLKLLHFLQEETNLKKCFQEAVMYAEQFGGGHVLEIGAGVAWTSALLSGLDKVLEKVSKLLVPGGIIMIVCERIAPEFPIYSINGLTRTLKRLLKRRQDSSGNYFYDDKEYRSAIVNAGLTYKFQLLDYPVYPGSSTLKAGNHFGIKANF